MTAARRIAFSILFVASAAFADTITFNPPIPSSTTPVDALVTGRTSGCAARQLGVSISGKTITLSLAYDPLPNGACGGALMPFSLTYHLGTLADGDYTVIAMHEGNTPATTHELARETLDVHDEQTVLLDPLPVPTRGGSVSIANPFSVDATSVIVGGVPVSVTNTADRRIAFDAPAHGAGTVDLTVYSSAGTAKGALVYYLAGATEPAYEAVLFPVAFEGAGAFGSQWTTENFVGGDEASFREALPLAAGTKRLLNDNQPWGRVLYAARGTIERTFFSSRARDLSRQAQSAGVDIPVVRERDFRVAPVELLNVPNDGRFRATLRLWTIDDAGSINIQAGGESQLLGTTRIPSTAISFASADITALLRDLAAGSPLRVQAANATAASPYVFAMITITNNETQEVTVVSSR